MTPQRLDLEIEQGATFARTLRLESDPIIYRPITNILQSAPCRLTVPAHGMPDGWRVAITAVKGMREINARTTPPRDSDWRFATVIDADTLELNQVDAQLFHPYSGGGSIQFNTPMPLDDIVAARMQIRPTIESSTVLLELSMAGGQIIVDDGEKRIDWEVDEPDTSPLSFVDPAAWDIELTFGTGEIIRPFYGQVVLSKQVTR